MSIRNKEAYMRQSWDWSCLDGCFGNTSISPMDIDGCVERRGHFLYLETKGVGVPLIGGQCIFFEKLVACPCGRHSVIIIWGPSGAPVAIQKLPGPIVDGDMEMLRRMVSEWFDSANK